MRLTPAVAIVIAVLCAAGSASAQRVEDRLDCRFPSIRVGLDQTISLRVAYPLLGQTGAPSRLRVIADFDLFGADSIELGEPPATAVSKLRFIERRSSESSVLPGEAASFRLGETFSAYAAGHLSLLGPAALELQQRGITVTGELTTRLDGRTLAILKPECGK